LIINEPGERLMFKVLKEDGTDVADEASYHIGVIHPTISFP
jgi:hypothetical protein